jgi:pimeloyl-ACP methyl ester carboxylesterase
VEAYYSSRWSSFLRFHDLPGREPALVFIHGLGCASSADFPTAAACPPLAGRRSILLDLLGFGLSDKPEEFDYSLENHAATVAEVLDHLGLRGCALIGHSMGGAIVVTLAELRPDLASSLVLAEGKLDPRPGAYSGPIAAQAEAEFVGSGWARFTEDIRQLALAGDAGMASYASTLAVCSPYALHRSATQLVKGTQPSARERFQRSSLPRTYVFGQRSLPDPDLERLSRHGIRVRVVPEAGHWMMDENPAGFAMVIGEAIDF